MESATKRGTWRHPPVAAGSLLPLSVRQPAVHGGGKGFIVPVRANATAPQQGSIAKSGSRLPSVTGGWPKSATILTTLRGTLETQRASVEAERNGLEGARADIETLKAALKDRLEQFNAKVVSLDSPANIVAMLPKSFGQSDGMGKVIRPLDDLANVWARYNNLFDPDHMTLMGGYDLPDFNADLALLKEAYTAYSTAENGLNDIRAQRNETQEAMYDIFLKYRLRIPTEFPPGSPSFETLPRLTPKPGSTPEPVTASGGWDPVAEESSVSWTESDDPNLAEYELRGVAGPVFDADDESVVGSFAPGAPRSWTGTWGIGGPGTAVSLRVYVKTTTGNERASNTVTITRPVVEG